MAENFEELYGELSQKPDFGQYFNNKEDFQEFITSAPEADKQLEDLFGVKSASEYLKKKDQPIIQNLAEESSSFQSLSGGQTENVVDQTQANLPENAGNVSQQENNNLMSVGFENSTGPSIPKPTPTNGIIKSVGQMPYTGSMKNQYQTLYGEIQNLLAQPNVNLNLLKDKTDNFVQLYKQFKSDPNAQEDLDAIVKTANKKFNVNINNNNIEIKPKGEGTQAINFAPIQKGAPFKEFTLTESLTELNKPKPVEQSQNLLESYVRNYSAYQDLSIATSSDRRFDVEGDLNIAGNQFDQIITPEINKILKSSNFNLPVNFYDNPALTTITTESINNVGKITKTSSKGLNPNRQLAGDYGLVMLDDANNPKINPIYIEDQVDKYLNAPMGFIKDETLKRLDMSKEDVIAIIKPRMIRLLSQRAEENLIENIVEKKVNDKNIFAEDISRANLDFEKDIKQLVFDKNKVLNSYSLSLANDFEQTMKKAAEASKQSVNLSYQTYLSFSQTPNITPEQNAAEYAKYVNFVKEENDKNEKLKNDLKKAAEEKYTQYQIQLDGQSEKDFEKLQKKYGVAHDANEEGARVTTAAYRKYRDAYRDAYDDFAIDEERNSSNLGWRIVDIIQGRAADNFENAIQSISAAVGYENNPLTGLLKHLQLVQKKSEVHISPFDKVLEVEGLLSTAALKNVVQNLAMQTVNYAPAMAATLLGGSAYVGGSIGFAQDTWDQTGQNYKNAFKRTGSVADAENAAAESLRVQLLLAPTYVAEMLPFTKGFLGKLGKGVGIGGIAKKFGAGTTFELLTEGAQELPQSYLEYKYTTENPDGFWDWTSKNGMSTMINITPTVMVLGGGSAMMETYREKQVEIAKNRVLNKLKDSGLSQMVSDAMQIIGEKGVGFIPEMLYRTGQIDANELADMRKAFDEVIKTFPAAKEIIENPDHQKYYLALASKKAKLQKASDAQTDENLKNAIDSQIKSLDKKMSDIPNGKNLNYTKITFDNKQSIIVDDTDLIASLNDEKFANDLLDGKIKVETQNQEITKGLEEFKKQMTENDTKVVSGPQIVTGLSTKASKTGAIVKDEEKLNLIADNARAAGQQNADVILDDAKRLQGVLDEATPGVNIVLLNTNDFNETMTSLDTKKNRNGNITISFNEKTGKFQAQIQINMDTANSTTIGHEVSHVLLLNSLGQNPELFNRMKESLQNVLASQVGEKNLANLNSLVEEYRDNQKGEEFLVELAALMSRDGKKLDLSTIDKIAKAISDFVAYVSKGRVQIFNSINNRKDFIEYMNDLSDTLASGQVTGKLKTNRQTEKTNKGSKETKAKGKITNKAQNDFNLNETIPVYHGGNFDNEGNNLYVASDRRQAKEFANMNYGKVSKFFINPIEMASEDLVRKTINDLGLKPREEGWTTDELGIHELLDPRFETSINEKDVEALIEKLKSQGYTGIAFKDEDILQENKIGVDNFLIFNKDSLFDSEDKVTKELKTNKLRDNFGSSVTLNDLLNKKPRIDNTINKGQIAAEKSSGTTQRANTVASYNKVANIIADVKGDVLDYGAGLGLGVDVLGSKLGRTIDSYEPNTERWQGKEKPTFTASDQINKKYDAVVSLNVLNVVPKDVRDAIVQDIYDKLNEGGKAVISTRKWAGDIQPTKGGKPGLESKSYKIESTGAYQKGFDGNELLEYIQDRLGPSAVVEKNNTFGAIGVTITKPVSTTTIINKGQLKNTLLIDENGNERQLGTLAEQQLSPQANKYSIGNVGKEAFNELGRFSKEFNTGTRASEQTIREQENHLEDWAKKNGIWINNVENLFPAPEYEIKQGMESKVWLGEGCKYVFKNTIANLYKRGFDYDFYRFAAHNLMFSNTAYEIVGFSRSDLNGKNQLSFVTKQPALSISFREYSSFSLSDMQELAKEITKQSGFEAKVFSKNGAHHVTITQKGLIVDDIHEKNAAEDADGETKIFDPYITIKDINDPDSFFAKHLKPIIDGYKNKGQLNYSNIGSEYHRAMMQSNNNKISSYMALINKGYTPKHIKEQIGLANFDENSFKQAQAKIAMETMTKVHDVFFDRQKYIKQQITNNLGQLGLIYEDLIADGMEHNGVMVNFSPLEIFKAVTDMDYMSNAELIDIFGAEYRETVKNALDANKEFPTDFMEDLEQDVKNLKVEQTAADVSNVLRQTGIGLVDSAVTMDLFLDYLATNGFDQIAIELTNAVKKFSQDRNLVDKTLDWADQVRSGKVGDNLYNPESIVYAFQVSSQLFSQAGRILQMARSFSEKNILSVLERAIENNGVVLTEKQKETLNSLANDYKTSQQRNKKALEELHTDWSDNAFDTYWASEKAIGDATIRLAQFLDARKPIFWNERITSGGSRALLGISTTVLSLVANVENNLWTTNYAARGIQKLRDSVGRGIKGNTLSFSNWKMARQLTSDRIHYTQQNNFKYGALNTSKGLNRYYDNLAQVNFFKDPAWAFNFMNVMIRKTTGKSLSEMTMEEQADALDLTLTKLKDGTIELRDGKDYTLARSLAWSFGLGPVSAVVGGNASMLLASAGPATSEFVGRVMAYGGDIAFGQMAAQRAMIDYFQNIEGTNYQGGVFDNMIKDAKGNLDKNAIRSLSTILYNMPELYETFEKEGLKRTLLADNLISGGISTIRGSLRKGIKNAYIANRANTSGTGIFSEAKRQFTALGISKNLLQILDAGLWTLMPFTKVPVNFLGSAIAKTVPHIASAKYIFSEGYYQYKYFQFHSSDKWGKGIPKLNSERKRLQYEKDKIELFAAKRQTTHDAAQMATSFAIYGFAMSAVKCGAVMASGQEPEKEKNLKNINLRGGIYNATLHYEYLAEQAKNAAKTGLNFFGGDYKTRGTDYFIARRGGFALPGDVILNTNNAGFVGYAMNLYGSTHNANRKAYQDSMTELVDDAKNGIGFMFQNTLSNGIETLPMFQGLARIGQLLSDFKDPEASKGAWENFASGTLSTSMAVFFPSFYSFMYKGNAQMVQNSNEIFSEREGDTWPAVFGRTITKTVQKLNRNISFNESTRNEFFKEAIGPFGEDLSTRVTIADPDGDYSAVAYLQAIFDPFAIHDHTTPVLLRNKEKQIYLESSKLYSGLIDFALMYEQMSGKNYEWQWNKKTRPIDQIIANPLKNDFQMLEKTTIDGYDSENVPKFIGYSLPNDLYRQELRLRGEFMRTSLRSYGDEIIDIKAKIKTNIEDGDVEGAKNKIITLFEQFQKTQKAANDSYMKEYYTQRQKKYLIIMKERGLITPDMMVKLKRVGIADENGLIP